MKARIVEHGWENKIVCSDWFEVTEEEGKFLKEGMPGQIEFDLGKDHWLQVAKENLEVIKEARRKEELRRKKYEALKEAKSLERKRKQLEKLKKELEE